MNVHAPAPLPSPEAEPRIMLSEVCRIAHLSRVTIQRRVKAEKLPKPIDRGTEAIFDRRAIYQALGIALESVKHDTEETAGADPWLQGAHAIAKRRVAAICGDKKPRRRRGLLLRPAGQAEA